MPETQYVGGRVADAGIDWLRVTVLKDHPNVEAISAVIRAEQRELTKLGIPEENRNWFGYQGVSADKLFIGESDERVMVQATSSAAKQCFELLRAHAAGVRCAKIDVQVTTRHETDERYFASNCKDRIRSFESHAGLGRQTDLLPWEKAKFGDSLYIGSPKSDWQTIIYDKTREQQETLDAWYWRREIKAKRKRAKDVFAEAMKWSDPVGFARSLVATRLKAYGLDEHWMNEQGRVELPSQRNISTIEQDLEYMRVYQTRKIQNLIKTGHGFEFLQQIGVEIRDGALFISEPVEPPKFEPIPPEKAGKPRRYKFMDFEAPPPRRLPHLDDVEEVDE